MRQGVSLEFAIDDFNKSLQAYYKRVQKYDAPILLKGIAIQALAEFIRLTPVDTGRARAGWFPAMRALGVPAGSGDEGGIRFSFGGEIQFIEVFNRVHYAIYLEYGHSKQAPMGMVRKTLAKMQARLDAAGTGTK